jgi:hypothetical protein
MELANRQVLVLQVVLGLVAWGSIAVAAWPALVRADRRRAVRWLVAPQMFRFVGMSLLATGVPGPGLSAEFAAWVATGDAVTSVLAIAAFAALARPGRAGLVLAAATTAVGAADLVHNLVMGMRLGAPDHLGGGWLVVALVVPGMLVAHALAARRLFGK